MPPVRHCSENTYILTNDLGERIEGLRSLGVRTPDSTDSLFTRFHQQAKDFISTALPEVRVISYDMTRLTEAVWEESIKLQKNLKDAIVVSSCAELASVRRGHTIEINRIVDVNGDVIGIGPRPGTPSLDHQISSIASFADGSPIVLAEDGAFTGYTIEHLVEMFKAKNVSITAVVVGICFPGAKESIRNHFDGEIIVVEETDRPFEWMPDHDFVPFAPNCGRVYGGRFGDSFLPFYTHDGQSYSFLYVLPFGDPVRWASIPQTEAWRFSLFCLHLARELYTKIDSLNGRKITMKDLAGSVPRISVPMEKGNSHLPDSECPVSEFLSSACNELS